MLRNEKGSVWYGLHFYPGVAEYRELGKEPYRVFLSESTIRKMDPTFAGRPVFVLHTEDELQGKSVDELRSMADGWVSESFFNKADGKHWVKFITVSEKADQKIKQGWTLSNAYYQKNSTHGGQWNGVSYQKEITDAEYDHLAIVPNPRYEESMVLTPEQFKTYNEEKLSELQRLQNNKKEGSGMKIKLFERKKVENSAEIESLVVLLPKSQKEMPLTEAIDSLDTLLVNKADKIEAVTIKLDDSESMTVGELKTKYLEIKNAYEELKNEVDCENEDDEESMDDEDDAMENEEGDEEDDEEEKKKKAAAEAAEKEKNKKSNKKKNELTVEEKKKKEKDRQKAENLRKANKNAQEELELTENSGAYMDGVSRGKARYGS